MGSRRFSIIYNPLFEMLEVFNRIHRHRHLHELDITVKRIQNMDRLAYFRTANEEIDSDRGDTL